MSKRCLGLGCTALLALSTFACGDGSSGALPHDSDAPHDGEPALDIDDGERPASGGQTGDDGGTDALHCEVVSATPLAFDELSPLGFAANAASPLVAHANTLPLEWLAPSFRTSAGDDVRIEYGPESGVGEVRLELELDEESARFTDMEDARSPGACLDRVELDANVSLQTAGGALLEQFKATLTMTNARVVQLEHTLEAPELTGGFAIDSAGLGELRTAGLVVMSSFTRYGTAGSLSAALEGPSGTSAERRQLLPVAGWPSELPCPVGGAVLPMLDTSAQPSMNDLLETLGSANPAGIFADGVVTAPLELRVTATDRWACFSPGDEQRGNIDVWTVGAELQLMSDARPPLPALPVRLRAETPPWSEQLGVSIEAQGLCATAGTYSVAEFEQHCGDWGFDLSDYDAAHLQFRDTSFTAGGGYGNVVIQGEKWPGCSWSASGRVCPDEGAVEFTVEEVGALNFGSMNRE